MSRTTVDTLCLIVPYYQVPEDEVPLFKVPVYITYSLDVDYNYGADADGLRGMPVSEYEILDIEFEEPWDRKLSAQVKRDIEIEATALFEQKKPFHYF